PLLALPGDKRHAFLSIEHTLRARFEAVAREQIFRRARGADLREDRAAAWESDIGGPRQVERIIPDVEEEPIDIRPADDRERAGGRGKGGPGFGERGTSWIPQQRVRMPRIGRKRRDPRGDDQTVAAIGVRAAFVRMAP